MSTSVRIVPHPRGHIASCNGCVEKVQARVERSQDAPWGGREVAMLVEGEGERQRERKMAELVHFQSQVKARVKRRVMVAGCCDVASWPEQRVSEQAVKLEKKPIISVEVAPDVEDVCIMGGSGGGDTGISQSQRHLSASQTARRNLLAQKGSADEQQHLDESHCLEKPPLQYQCTDTHDSHSLASVEAVRSERVVCKDHRGEHSDHKPKTKFKHKAVHQLTAPGQLEHVQKRQAGVQYLLFRRLYSDLERERVRQRCQLQAHQQCVQRLKRRKEGDRRLAEKEINTLDSFSMLSSEEEEEQQKVAEWGELVALEERRQQLQRAREEERYLEAMRGRLRERLAQSHCYLPPLCSCGPTVWDTNPETCANNCVFYRNPKAYAKALSRLLLSFEHKL